MFFIKENKVYEKDSVDIIKSSLYGFIIGDALGVPVEFLNRETLKRNPIKDMEEYGTHNQPRGTWSDDTSMLLATIDGLINSTKSNIDYKLIMTNFLKWMNEGEFTPFKHVFDIGNSTRYALSRYQNNIYDNKDEEIICGTGDINSNGNGSLMRILPISLYLYYSGIDYQDKNFFEIIKTISGMTHSHIYSILACYIYSVYVIELIKTNNKLLAYKNMQNTLKTSYLNNYYSTELKDIYGRLIYQDINKLKESDIKSSGYVVDSLEATIWCILTTNSFEKSILTAVNLGDDTDTIAALTGALAGIIYGYNAIPEKWLITLQSKEYLDNIINNFIKYLNGNDSKFIYKQILKSTVEELKNNKNACLVIKENPLSPISCPSNKLHDFFSYMYDNDLIDKEYLENSKKNKLKKIEDMTKEEVLTELTFIHRAERFGGGSIYDSFKNNTLLRLVERLYELSNNE